MSNVALINELDFNTELLSSHDLLLVVFTAAWCPPCQSLTPTIEELATEYRGTVKIARLDVDNCAETAAKYRVMCVPTVVFFRNGQETARITGNNPKAAFVEKINGLMNGAEDSSDPV